MPSDGRSMTTPRPPRPCGPACGLVELERRVAHELLPLVGGVDLADRPRLRAHHQTLRRRAVTPVAHPLEQVAVGDARRGEEHVLARDEIVGPEHAVEVVAGVECGAPFVVVAGPEATDDLSTERFERRGRDHPFGRAADAEENVRARIGPRRRDRAGYVTVGDQLDTRARFSAFTNDVGMAFSVAVSYTHLKLPT